MRSRWWSWPKGPRMMTNIVDCPQTPEALQLDMPLEVVFDKQNDDDHPAPVPSGEGLSIRCAEVSHGRRRGRDHRARRHSQPLADPAARRRGAERDGRLRAEAVRHRRRRHRGGNAGADRALSRHHADLGGRHVGRRLLVHDPRAPRRGGDRDGAVQDGPDHPRRKRQIARRQSAALRCRRQSCTGSSSSPTARWARPACSPFPCCAT